VGQYEGLSDDGTISEGSQTAEGITCSACHKKEPPVGLFLLASLETGTPPGPKPAQRTPEFCAQCHNQTEPLVAMFGLAGYPDEIAAGNPFEEWQSNKFSQQGPEYMACIDCHGRRGTGTLHRWPREQAELIRSAYTIDLLRTQATETGWRVGISITNTGAGHMFPTGDPGHVVTLEAMLMDENNTMLANGRIVFSHIKSSADGGYIVDDNRLSPGSLAECWITIDDPGNSMAGTANLILKYVVRYSYDPAAEAALKTMGVEPESLLVDENTITLPQLTL
jgi:cytochrome c553